MIASLNILDPLLIPNLINRQHSLNQGRVGWWLTVPGLEGGLYCYDLMGSAYNGTLVNMDASSGWRGTTRPGGFGHLQFDGSNDYVIAPIMPNYTDFTVAAWFYAADSTNGSAARIVDRQYANGFWLGKNAGGITNSWGGGIQQSGAPYGTYVSCTDGQWHRLVMSRQGTAQKVYVDGVLGATATVGSTAFGNDPTQFGAASGGGNYFKGNIDDVSIWNRALTDNEVRGDYDLSRAGYPGVLNRLKPAIYALSSGTVYNPTATLTGVGSINASATQNLFGTASLNGVGSLSSSATQNQFASVSLTGIANISSAATVKFSPSASLTCVGSLSSSATQNQFASALLTGVGSLSGTASGSTQLFGTANLAGVGSLSASPILSLSASANLTGVSSLTSSVTQNLFATANLVGVGSLVSNTPTVTFSPTVSLVGVGNLASGSTTVKFSPSVSLTGVGSLRWVQNQHLVIVSTSAHTDALTVSGPASSISISTVIDKITLSGGGTA